MKTAGVIGTALLLLTACGGNSHGPLTTPTTSSASLPSYVVAKVDVGGQPCAVEGGFGSIWVSQYGKDTELRIDPATRKVIARIKTNIAPCGIAVGGGAVWVEDYGGNDVARIDPQTNQATRIKVGSAPYDVTYFAGAAWVTNYGDDTVSRIDAKTFKVSTIKVDGSPVGVAPAGGAVWVTSKTGASIDRIDPTTLAVTSTKVGYSPTWTSWGDGRLWIARGHTMTQIGLSGPRQGRAISRAGIGTAIPLDGDIVGGTVWVGDNAGKLHGYDARTGQQRGVWPLGLTQPFVLAGYAGKLWTVDFQGTALEEIDPAALR